MIIQIIFSTGYYRVNYDYKNWLKISHYLNNENHTKIHVLNRAQIIDDAFHFMIINQLNSSIFWNITKYLVKETDYVAWYPMFKALEYMSSIFPFTNRIAGNIKVLTDFLSIYRCYILYLYITHNNDFVTTIVR